MEKSVGKATSNKDDINSKDKSFRVQHNVKQTMAVLLIMSSLNAFEYRLDGRAEKLAFPVCGDSQCGVLLRRRLPP